MNCPICNSNIPNDSTFCSNCKTTFIVCSKCGAYLPGDSRFCPDCGSPVVNIEELRAKAKDIVFNYKEGYEFYVKTGILPCKCYDSSAEICEKIIAMSAAIIERHKQIKEEELIRETASSITIQYAKAYNYYVNIGAIPRFVHNLDIAQCQQIIAKKNDIIGKHYEILKQERADDEKKKREEEFHEKYVEYIHQKRAEPINNESKTGVFYFIVGAFVTCSTGPFVMWLSGSQEPLSIILYSLIIDVLVGLIWSFVLGGKSKD